MWAGGYPVENVKISTRHSQLSRAATRQLSTDDAGIPHEAQQAVDALAALYRALEHHNLPSDAWISSILRDKANEQFNDTLSMATSALPDWLGTLPRVAPFLFPLDLRKTLFRSTVCTRPEHSLSLVLVVMMKSDRIQDLKICSHADSLIPSLPTAHTLPFCSTRLCL